MVSTFLARHLKVFSDPIVMKLTNDHLLLIGFVALFLFLLSVTLYQWSQKSLLSRIGTSRGERQTPLSPQTWNTLRSQLQGKLIVQESPLKKCNATSSCGEILQEMENPYYLSDHSWTTQTTGWLNAWTSSVSHHIAAVETPQDVVAAVNFARKHRIKLVVKGTGHDYMGRSNASPNSLLVWTRKMNKVTVNDSFVPAGGRKPSPAVIIETGAQWIDIYDEVMNKHGTFVLGGGCTSVGVAGFILGGGFGPLSKRYGTGAASLLEVEIVTADGKLLVANQYQNRDLFWALKGSGCGSYGIATKITLQTHDPPKLFGILTGKITAHSDQAYKNLLIQMIGLYRDQLSNKHWGESISISPKNEIELGLVFNDLTKLQAQTIWRPLLEWIKIRPHLYTIKTNFSVLPFKDLYDPKFMKENYPEMVELDDRSGSRFWWKSNQAEVSAFIFTYKSRWLPMSLYENPTRLAGILFEASRHREFVMTINKSLSGAEPNVLARERQTCLNPTLLKSAAWVRMKSIETNAYPQVAGHKPDMKKGKEIMDRVNKGMKIIEDATPGAGTYSNEADYYEKNWQHAYWGKANYQKLLVIKKKYDPHGLFQPHQSVGSKS